MAETKVNDQGRAVANVGIPQKSRHVPRGYTGGSADSPTDDYLSQLR